MMTARLRLTPVTVVLAWAELTDRTEFARLLPATMPDEWPCNTDALKLWTARVK